MWPIKLAHRLKRSAGYIGALILACFYSTSVQASFLDSDFWCRTYGCAVIHDGDTYDIYDNYIFSINSCCVGIGQPLISYYSRADTPNITGTLDAVTDYLPNQSQSMQMGISQNGTIISTSLLDDGDGYLDAGDQMGAFTLNPDTDILLDGPGRSYSHSFFITSRDTKLSLRALASIVNSTGELGHNIQLGDIKLTPSIQASGNDSGFSFGTNANSNNIKIANGVNDLGDLTGQPTQIIKFSRKKGIRRKDGNINTQTIRLDFRYDMPDYDFSMGTGRLNIDVAFDLYRE